ncbi:MAG TPA: LLM class F420-dependent oxidoreductase [Actinomycetota bacterium]|nr:LLM class F420-dependent oxidoreductase [Actinomycetota bacterium]
MSARIGFTAPLLGHDVRASAHLAREAEDLGYTDCWTAETSGPDGFSTAAAVGIATERLTVGCAVVPVYSRPPALTAMSALAAQQASGGRFCLGLGASSPVIVEGWMGVPLERPVERIKETIEIVRTAFAGTKVDYSGTTVSVRGFRLDPPPDPAPPIFVAALGPRMTRLAAEVADGIALYLATPTGVTAARKAAGTKPVMERILCCPDEPVDEARGFIRWLITPYLAVPAYNRFIERQGWESVARAVAERWADRDRDGAREAIPDELIDELVLLGSAGECKEKLERFTEAGLDIPVLMFVSTKGPDASVAALRALAP